MKYAMVRKTMKWHILAMVMCSLTILSWLPATMADVVHMKNGKRMEGKVYPAPGDPTSIVLQNSQVRLTISRDRVESIKEEPDAIDFRRIGDQFYNDANFDKALEYYLMAQKADPGDETAAAKVQATREATERAKSIERHQQLDALSLMLDEAEKYIEAKTRDGFLKAQEILYEKAPQQGPTADQLKRIKDLKIKLHLAWALELQDKLVTGEAGEHFEKVLQLDPNNRVAFDNLIEIWEKDSAKTPQVVEALKVKLRLNSNDMQTRRKLAEKNLQLVQMKDIAGETPQNQIDRMYEDVAEQLEWLYENDNYYRARIEDQLAQTFETLYKRAEARKEYDAALKWYRKLDLYSDKTSDSEYKTLGFLSALSRIDTADVETRTSLSLQARDEGLNILALREIQRLDRQYPNHPTVQSALQVFANDELQKAVEALASGQNERAETLALQVANKYPEYEDLIQRAEQIQNLARVNIEQNKRKSAEEGRRYKELADQRYNEGLRFVAMMQSTEVDTSVRIVSHRREAISSFQDAIKYYDMAVRKWTSMDQVTKEEISHNQQEARKYIRSLTKDPAHIPQGPNTRY